MVEHELKELILSRYGNLKRFSDEIGIAWSTLDGVLKRGVNKANITSLIKICEGLNIDCESLYYGRILPKQELLKTAPLSLNEENIIKKYRALDEHGKKVTDMLLDAEYDRCTIKEKQMDYISTVMKPSYQANLSAGTGLFVFDDVPTEQIEVPSEYSYIDFVIGVSGDSMEPTYTEKDKVMIVKQPQINIGEIGAFMINGEAFIKELSSDGLISHNKKYPLIKFEENMRIDCIGKVVGKL